MDDYPGPGDALTVIAKAKSLVHNMWAHDLANRLKIRRKEQAKTAGLGDDWDVGTYPSASTKYVRTGFGPFAMLASMIIGGGLLLGGMWLYREFVKLPQPPPATDTDTRWKIDDVEWR